VGSIPDEVIGFFSIDLILPAALWIQYLSNPCVENITSNGDTSKY
jgi:hypothetical protein